jgi:hypothetical protein
LSPFTPREVFRAHPPLQQSRLTNLTRRVNEEEAIQCFSETRVEQRNRFNKEQCCAARLPRCTCRADRLPSDGPLQLLKRRESLGALERSG